MAAIEQGIVTSTTKSRLIGLEARRDACERSVQEQGDHSPVPALHPGLAEI